MNSGKEFTLKITVFLLGLILILLLGFPFVNDYYYSQKGQDLKTDFHKFLERFNKSYKLNQTEYQKRYESFKGTLQFIQEANAAKSYGENVRFGVTRFSDMTDEEFRMHYLNDNRASPTKYGFGRTELPNNEIPQNLPLRVDWRERGIVTAIRNQGHCGSCYAQSVIGTIESAVALNYNLTPPMEFSVQQMIDCAENFNAGCLGGDTCDLLDWLKTNRVKILPRRLYPEAVGSKFENCKNISITDDVKTVRVLRYTCLNFTNYENEILNILAFKGPLSASVNGLLWKNYLGGVIKYHCNGPSNHAVQIVGYDLSPPDPHYIVRNSWGMEFGNEGFAKIAIGKNVCNIASEVSMVQVEWG